MNMLKKVMKLALCALGVASFAFGARAGTLSVDYTLYLTNGVAYKAEACEEKDKVTLSGLSFADGVWTMNNFTFETTAAEGIVCLDKTTVIKVEGVNAVEVAESGDRATRCLHADGEEGCSLTILGTDPGSSSLTLTAGDYTGNPRNQSSEGINAINLIIKDATVKATGGAVSAHDDAYSSGIYVAESLVVIDAIVTAEGKQAGCVSAGVEFHGPVIILGNGKVTASSSSSDNPYGVTSLGDAAEPAAVAKDDSDNVLTYDVEEGAYFANGSTTEYANKVTLTKSVVANYSIYLKDGKAYADETYTLDITSAVDGMGLKYADGVWTMNNFTFETTAQRGVTFFDRVTIVLKGKNVVTAGDTTEVEEAQVTGMNLAGYAGEGVEPEVTFTGDGSLVVTARLPLSGGNPESIAYGLSGYATKKFTGGVQVTAVAQGGNTNSIGLVSLGYDLILSNANVTATSVNGVAVYVTRNTVVSEDSSLTAKGGLYGFLSTNGTEPTCSIAKDGDTGDELTYGLVEESAKMVRYTYWNGSDVCLNVVLGNPLPPEPPRVITKPWLQNVYTNRFTVMFETKGKMDGLTLQYGSDYKGAAPTESRDGVKAGTFVYKAEVEVDGAAGETIQYCFATNGVKLAGTEGSVTLWKDGDAAFTCAIWGDNQEGVQKYDWGNDVTAERYRCITNMFAHMAAQKPDFGFATGDFSSDALYDEEIEPGELRGTDDLFGRTIPYHLVWGNHDCSTTLTPTYTDAAQRYFAPAASEEDIWFYFYRNDVLFIGVHWLWERDAAAEKYKKAEKGIADLLATDRAKNAKFRVIVQHTPVYLETYSLLADSYWFVDSRLIEVAKAGGVDVVFSGHTHAYERIEQGGLVQIVNGGMGYLDHGERWYNNYGSDTKVGGHQNTPLLWARQTPSTSASNLNLAPAQPVRMGCFQGYGMLSVEGNTLTYKAHAFNADGSYIGVADSFALESRTTTTHGTHGTSETVEPFTPSALTAPVNNATWAAFKQSQGESWSKPAGAADSDPVVNVSKTEIERFCAALNKSRATNYRLPTVAELTEAFGGNLKRDVSEWTADVDANSGWCRILGGNKKAVDYTWCRQYDKPAMATADCHADYLGFRVIDAAAPVVDEPVMDKALAALAKIENPAEVYLWKPESKSQPGYLKDITKNWTGETPTEEYEYYAPVIFTGKGDLKYAVSKDITFNGGVAAPNATSLDFSHITGGNSVTVKKEFRGGVATNEWCFYLKADALTLENVTYRGQVFNAVTDSRTISLVGTNDFSGAVMSVAVDSLVKDPNVKFATRLVAAKGDAILWLRRLDFANRNVAEEVIGKNTASFTVDEGVTLVTTEDVLFGIKGATLTVNGALDAAGVDIAGHLLGALKQDASLLGTGKVRTTHFGMCDKSTLNLGVCDTTLLSSVPYRTYSNPTNGCNIKYVQREPDYTQAKDWLLNHYLKPDEAKSVAGEPSQDPGVDLVYVYGTIAMTNAFSTVNDFADLNDPQMRGDEATHTGGAWGMIPGSVKAFSDYTRVYVPFYRQMTLCGATNVMAGAGMDGANKAFAEALRNGVAYEDLEAALDTYFAKWNQGRPFILAGCSQGAAMLRNMVEHYFKQPPNKAKLDRLVACYGIAYGVTKDWADNVELETDGKIHFATNATERGVYVSWNTVGPDSANIPNGLVPPGAISINPLTWTTEATPAAATLNLGSLTNAVTGAIFPHLYDATVDTVKGVVVSTNLPASDYVKGLEWFGDKSLHTWEMSAWWENLRANAYQRIETATGKKPCCGTPTDYADEANWMSRPAAEKPLDVFYLYPTCVPGTCTTLVGEIEDGMKAAAKEHYKKGPSAFESYANVYAPYYRQGSGLALVSDLSPDGIQRFCSTHVVKTDVFAALDYFFTNINVKAERPFILASHSQGSANMKNVFEEYFVGEKAAYRKNMVAAYVLGYKITPEWCEKVGVKFATGADDTGVVMTWNAEGPGETGDNFLTADPTQLAINPINWATNETAALTAENLGSVITNAQGILYSVKPGVTGARLQANRAGAVIVDDPGDIPVGISPGFGTKSYHFEDWGFFHDNIGVNGFVRYAAFVDLKPVETDSIPEVAETTWKVMFKGQGEQWTEALESPLGDMLYVPSAAEAVRFVYTLDAETAARDLVFTNGYASISFPMTFDTSSGAWASALSEEKIQEATKTIVNTYFITFSAKEPFGIRMWKNWDPSVKFSLECSTDKTHWAAFDWKKGAAAGADNKLYLRGTGNTAFGCLGEGYYAFTSTEDSVATAIACAGNIMTLLDWQTVAKGAVPPMGAFAFINLFKNFAALTSAPELPSTELSDFCYKDMFYGCKSLAATPELPAETLTDHCYSYMFYGCTSLTAASKLCATNLSVGCYSCMFNGCTSLMTAPELPATTLTPECYYCMFKNCTSLEKLPVLPAKTLANTCYQSMFAGCTQFALCTSGEGTPWSIPDEAVAAGDWNMNMFSGVAGDIAVEPNKGPVIGKKYYVRPSDERVVISAGTVHELKEDKAYMAPATKEDGGAFYVEGGAKLVGTNVSFVGNCAGKGGAIYSKGDVDLSGAVLFSGNTATGDVGGALVAHGKVTIDGDVTFTNNAVKVGDVCGGAVQLEGGSVMTVSGKAVFACNRSGHAGAVNVNKDSTLRFDGESLWIGNAAAKSNGDGGALYNKGTVVFQKKTVFSGNSANNAGGAIFNCSYWSSPTVIFRDELTLVTDTDTITNMANAKLVWDLTEGGKPCLNGYQRVTNENGGQLVVKIPTYEDVSKEIVIATGDFTDLAGKDTFTVENTDMGTTAKVTVGGVAGTDWDSYSLRTDPAGATTNLVLWIEAKPLPMGTIAVAEDFTAVADEGETKGPYFKMGGNQYRQGINAFKSFDVFKTTGLTLETTNIVVSGMQVIDFDAAPRAWTLELRPAPRTGTILTIGACENNKLYRTMIDNVTSIVGEGGIVFGKKADAETREVATALAPKVSEESREYIEIASATIEPKTDAAGNVTYDVNAQEQAGTEKTLIYYKPIESGNITVGIDESATKETEVAGNLVTGQGDVTVANASESDFSVDGSIVTTNGTVTVVNATEAAVKVNGGIKAMEVVVDNYGHFESDVSADGIVITNRSANTIVGTLDGKSVVVKGIDFAAISNVTVKADSLVLEGENALTGDLTLEAATIVNNGRLAWKLSAGDAGLLNDFNAIAANGSYAIIANTTAPGTTNTLAANASDAVGMKFKLILGETEKDIKVAGKKGSAVAVDGFALWVEDDMLKLSVPETTLLEITAESASKPYDGEPLTLDDYAITRGALKAGHTLVAYVDGEILDVGREDNVVEMDTLKIWATDPATGAFIGDRTGEYQITCVTGKLEVTKAEMPVVIAAKPARTDDGEANGFTYSADALMAGEEVVATVEVVTNDEGLVYCHIADCAILRGTKDVTANYTVVTLDSTVATDPNAEYTVITAAKDVPKVASGKEVVFGTPENPQIIDFQRSSTTFSVGANATYALVGEMWNATAVKVSAGTKKRADGGITVQGTTVAALGVLSGTSLLTSGSYTEVTVDRLTGTKKTDRVMVGSKSVFVAGGIDLGAGADTLSVGADAYFVSGDIENVETLSFASRSTNEIGNVIGVRSLRLTSGKAATTKAEAILSRLVAGDMEMSAEESNNLSLGDNVEATFGDVLMGTANDTVTVGANATVAFGCVDFGGGKDKLTVGKNSTVTLIATEEGCASLTKFTIGKGAVAYLSSELIAKGKALNGPAVFGKGATVIDLGPAELADAFTTLEEERADNSEKTARTLSGSVIGWLSDVTDGAGEALDAEDYFVVDRNMTVNVTKSKGSSVTLFVNGTRKNSPFGKDLRLRKGDVVRLRKAQGSTPAAATYEIIRVK